MQLSLREPSRPQLSLVDAPRRPFLASGSDGLCLSAWSSIVFFDTTPRVAFGTAAPFVQSLRTCLPSAVGLRVVQQQFFHVSDALSGLLASAEKVAVSFVAQRFADAIKQCFLLFAEKNENLLLN